MHEEPPNRAQGSGRAEGPAGVEGRPLRRRRVLISAIATSPARGSEAGVGWNIPSRVAQYHDVTLMCSPGTHDHQRQEIEAYLKEHGPIPGLVISYVDQTPVYRLFDPQRHPLMRPVYYVGYASWQRAAYRRALELHAHNPFDLTHHLTIVGFREPGYLWKLPIPFFWGPVAGASNLPWRYLGILRWRDRLTYGLRNIANELQKRLHRRPRLAARAAAHVWAVGEDNHRMFVEVFGVPAERLCEVGGNAQPDLASVKHYDPRSEPLRLVWAGYHIGRKAVPLVLRAIARIREDFPVHLTCLGKGPEKATWQSLSQRLGVAECVTWLPEQPHGQAMERLASAHVLAFPSLQEASSTVVLEALSLGLPVLCHDACGMAFVVTDECGIKIPMRSPHGSIEGLADAMRRLHRNPSELTDLSRGALRRAEELSWDHVAREIAAGYDRVLQAAG